MGFFAAFVVGLIFAVVGELLRPKSKPPNAKPSSLDDFDIPTAEEGRAITLFAGKVKLTGPNCVWYGNLSVTPIKKKVKTGWFSSATQILGYKYRLSMQLVFGWGYGSADGVQVHEIRFGDAQPKHTRGSTVDGLTVFQFDDENFYGGPEKEGGVSGKMSFYHGTDSQTANAHMAEQVGETFPAYKNLCHAVLENMYLGTSAYIKPISAIVSRYPNQLGVPDGHHIIGEDSNPICFLYELMTDQVWGVGLLPTDIDTEAFLAAAETVWEEGFGMSPIYNGSSNAKDVAAELLRHLDGAMFSDPETGLIVVKLARKDYVVADLPVLGKDEFQEGIKFTRPSWSETINSVKSTYVDRTADFTVAVESQQDLANITQRGGQISQQEYDYTGFTTHAAARAATARTLKTVAYPLARMAGTLDRRFWKLKPAGLFVLHWPERGINNVVMRITRVNYQSLQRNLIEIDAVEDIFNITHIAYIDPGPSGWENPVGDPTPMTRQLLLEAPAFGAPNEAKYVITMGSKAPAADVGYDVMINDEFANTALAFTPSGVLHADLAENTAYEIDGIELSGMLAGSLIDQGPEDGASRGAGHNLMLINGELLAWKNFSIDEVTGRYVFDGNWRGVLDTVPQTHTAGAIVWLLSEGAGLAGEDGFAADVTLDVKLLPRTIRGALDADDAVEMSITTNSRSARPLPPGDPRIDGARFVDVSTESGQFTVTWTTRNRFHGQVLPQNAVDVAPEDGTLYTLRVYNDDTEALIIELEEFDAQAADVTLNVTANIRLELFATFEGGLESWSAQIATFAYSPAGETENTITPDEAVYILDGGGA